MRLCREYGISHSHFLGGPDRWTDADRDKARALEIHLRSACSQCGTFDEDWRDPITKRELDEPRYMVVTHRCVGCERMATAREEAGAGEKGLFVGLGPWVDPEVADMLEEMAEVHPADDEGG